jgi:hypothetical protein
MTRLWIIGKAATEVAVMGASLNLPRLDKESCDSDFRMPSTAALPGQVNNIRQLRLIILCYNTNLTASLHAVSR